MQDQKTTQIDDTGIANRLKSNMTVTAPTWAFALAAVIALVLLGVALD